MSTDLVDPCLPTGFNYTITDNQAYVLCVLSSVSGSVFILSVPLRQAADGDRLLQRLHSSASATGILGILFNRLSLPKAMRSSLHVSIRSAGAPT
jgi:hypothetical protein